MAEPTLGERIFGTAEEQRLRYANSKPANGFTGRGLTPFELAIANANAVSAAETRLRYSGPLNSNYFLDVRTRQLGFSCDTNLNAPIGVTKCTGAQRDAIKLYERGNSNAVVAQRYRDNKAKALINNANQIAAKPAAAYAAEIVSTATPEMKEAIRRDMIKKGLLHPLETTWNSSAEVQLTNYYSGPSTLGSSEGFAAQAAANLAQVGKDTRTVSYEPADMRAAAIARRALANNAKLDDQTNRDNQAAAIDAVAKPIITAQRKEAFPVYDALANAVVSQSGSARGPAGKTPVVSKKKNKKVARPPVSKLKKKNR